MNYKVDILEVSGHDESYKNAVKKYAQRFNSTYTKQEISQKVAETMKELGLNHCTTTKETNSFTINLFQDSSDSTPYVKVCATPVSKTEKVVVKFAEHKYFKNLKHLYGTYKTELSQNEGSSTVTTDAYVRGVLGNNFHVTDLSQSDKFVGAEEIDLRSPYMESLNNVLFESTHKIEGEIYGITENGKLFVAGKRVKPHLRMYDNKLISTLDDITPAYSYNDTIQKLPGLTSDIYFDELDLENPKLTNFTVRKPMNDTYWPDKEPEFKYFKNLLIFEAKVDLHSPRMALKPDLDEGEFQLITSLLNSGDKIESALALDGQGTRTHTIVTNIKQRCKYLAAQGNNLVAIMADNKIWTAEDVNYDAVNAVTMTNSGKEFTETGAQLVDMFYDSTLKSWVGSFGYEADAGVDFYGDNYYRFMVAKTMPDSANANGRVVYNQRFSSKEGGALEFVNRSSSNLLKRVKGAKYVEVIDTYGEAYDESMKSKVSPDDIAISSYDEMPKATASELGITVGSTVRYINEGPYIVDPSEYEKDGSKMYQKIFSDGDVDLVLQQDYIFVKNNLYTVDDNGNYTRTLTKAKHWLGAKMPITLDTTMLKLRALPVDGATSCYKYVQEDLKTFCSWALDTAMTAEQGDEYTFTNLSLKETYTEAELNDYKAALSGLNKAYNSDSNDKTHGLLTYAQFVSLGVKFYSGDEEVECSVDSYGSSEKAITKVVFKTALPLDTQKRIDSSKNYELICDLDSGVIESSMAYKNFINFEEAYRQYLFIALTAVRGVRSYENFGAKSVVKIHSFGGKIYFRLYTGDVIFIEKKNLRKAEDIEAVSNWRVSIMPTGTYLNGWNVQDLKSLSGYETVTLKTGKELPVNNKEQRIYFFKTTSEMFAMSDNLHIFIGGYAYSAETIYDVYNNMGGGEFDRTQEWWKNNIESWIGTSDDEAHPCGKTPIVLYSDDGGTTFKMLPIKRYLPSSIYEDGKDRQVQHFSITKDGKVAGYVQEAGGAYTTNQVIIDFDDLVGNVDPTKTRWAQVGVNPTGEIRSIEVDDGTITYTTGAVGYGVDIDLSEMRGSDSFNIDFTGNNAITLPEGLMVTSVDNGNAIRFNKAISEDSSISGTYRVLFAAYTRLDIPNQEKYLSSNPSILGSYINSKGNLKVDSIKQVETALTANRVCIKNFPKVSEDTNKTYYEYKDPVYQLKYDTNGDPVYNVAGDPSSGQQMEMTQDYTVVPLTNQYTNNIVQCDDTGKVLDITINGTLGSVDFASSLGQGLSESQLVVAGKPKGSINDFLNNASLMEVDEAFTNSLKAYNITLDGYNTDGLFCNFVLGDTNLLSYCDKAAVEDWKDYSAFITTQEDAWGFPDNQYSSESDRYIYKTNGGHNYLFDKKYNVYVLKSRRYIEGTLNIPYVFYNGGNGTTVIPDPIIEYCETAGRTDEMVGAGALANSIFYHPMGYGGLRNNFSMTETTPWKRDPVAFKSEGFLKNSFGDYVFLTDNTGKKLKVFDAIQLSDGTAIDIDYDSFLHDGLNEVKFYNTTAAAADFKVYKLKRTDIYQCHTTSYVKQGSKVGLRFYKNTDRITNVSLAEGYLFNSKGEKCYEATIENGMLVVGNALEAGGSELTAKFKVEYTVKGKTFDEVVESKFTLNGSNSAPWIDEIIDDNNSIFYYKDKGLLSKVTGDSTTIDEEYKLKLTDADGSLSITNDDIVCSNCTASIDSNDVVTINVAAGFEKSETYISINGFIVWSAPIIEITDEIVKRNSTYYLGDNELDSSIVNPIESEVITGDFDKVLYLGYHSTKDVPAGVLIEGLWGYSVSRIPEYSNFQNLLYSKGTIIEKGISFNESQLTQLRISEIASDNSEIKFNAPFKFTDKYNDGNEHYFRFKILTILEQDLAPKVMNNPDYYYELTKEQMKQFAPNRVWYNPKGSPVPPIKVGSKIFNAENNYAYYGNDYKNANGIKIYICDEEGHFVNYDENGIDYRLDDNNDGNCSKNVYIGVDNRYVSPEPINPTCQDWYYENIYTPNNEVNPLWQVIRIAPKIENKKWVQHVELCRYKKNGATQTLTPDVDSPYVTINELSQIIAENGALQVENNFDVFDPETGKISLLLSEGSSEYKRDEGDEDITMYGLNFNVKKLRDMYNENDFDIASTLQASYTVNTLRDFTTPIQGDSAIAKITELGIFDKNHKLIAYAQFPPIEYRTDSQHASFTCVIYHGNMTND